MRKKRPTQNSPARKSFHQRHQALHRRRSVGDHADACCGIFGAAIGLRRRQLQCWWFWKMCTHLVTCFVCCRCATGTCRRLIRTGDADACRDPRPHNESAIALLGGERLEGDLLRAALSKKAALISSSQPAPIIFCDTFFCAARSAVQSTNQVI